MHVKRIAVISIPVSDQAKAKSFYMDTLGFALVRESPFGNGQTWVELVPATGQTSVTLVTWFPTMKPGGVTGLVLETSDIEADYEALRARGLVLTPLESAQWGRYATFSDPDGNGWVLQQYTQLP